MMLTAVRCAAVRGRPHGKPDPAERAGVYHAVGNLERGKLAALVVLDRDLQVQRVFIEGVEFEHPALSRSSEERREARGLRFRLPLLRVWMRRDVTPPTIVDEKGSMIRTVCDVGDAHVRRWRVQGTPTSAGLVLDLGPKGGSHRFALGRSGTDVTLDGRRDTFTKI
jgi:hypothetical protein